MLIVAAARQELGDLDGDVVGVGPVVAAARAAAILAERKPEAVLLLGTAGAYPGGPAVGSAVVAARFGLSYGVATLGLGYVPRAPRDIEADPALVARSGLERHAVLTVGAVTTDPTLAGRLGADYTVEHLEAFAVAFACQEAGVPFAAVLGIASTVGPDAHLQWLTHREEAQAAARDAVRTLLGV